MAGFPMLVLTVSALCVVSGNVVSGQETACDGDCVGTFDKCVGKNIFSLKTCCEDGDQCVMKNKWFGQCRPISLGDRFVPQGWAGPVVDCSECGPDSLQPGEFNYANNEYCDIVSLGSLTLQQCAADCKAGGYVACDRLNVPAGDSGSCWGYFELFEGGCNMRNDNTAWNSWLTCKDPVMLGAFIDVVDEMGVEEPPVSSAKATAAVELEAVAEEAVAEETVAEDASGMTAEEQKAAAEAGLSPPARKRA